jgi:hypothetical protein
MADRVCDEGRYSPFESESEAVGVGTTSKAAEASVAHSCVPPLRNEALDGRVNKDKKRKGRASAACARPCRRAYSTSMCSMPGISSGHLYPANHISCCAVVPFFRACLIR